MNDSLIHSVNRICNSRTLLGGDHFARLCEDVLTRYAVTENESLKNKMVLLESNFEILKRLYEDSQIDRVEWVPDPDHQLSFIAKVRA